jgi:hypothetical protein
MAKLNNNTGSIIAHCQECNGAQTNFEWKSDQSVFGSVKAVLHKRKHDSIWMNYRLFRCSGCGHGAIAAIMTPGNASDYPTERAELIWFYPEATFRLNLPSTTPDGIKSEFMEAEQCMSVGCYRAAAGLFRSVLEKTLSANGYKTNKEKNLIQRIDAATNDKIITEARRKRAHEEIRVLGNDVLHDEWRKLVEDDVTLAHHYCQRIIEDFYDERYSVLQLLKDAGRTPEEDN